VRPPIQKCNFVRKATTVTQQEDCRHRHIYDLTNYQQLPTISDIWLSHVELTKKPSFINKSNTASGIQGTAAAFCFWPVLLFCPFHAAIFVCAALYCHSTLGNNNNTRRAVSQTTNTKLPQTFCSVLFIRKCTLRGCSFIKWAWLWNQSKNRPPLDSQLLPAAITTGPVL
jgi:hypothetical protein